MHKAPSTSSRIVILPGFGSHQPGACTCYAGIPAWVFATLLFMVLWMAKQHVHAQTGIPFPSTPLAEKGDLSAKMVQGISRYLLAETDRLEKERPGMWTRDFTDEHAFNKSVASQRELLLNRLGIVGKRIPPDLAVIGNSELEQSSIEAGGARVYAVKWQSIEGLPAEGLLITPATKVTAQVVLIPDADMQPEVLAGLTEPAAAGFAVGLQLARAGVEILIPELVNRGHTFSGNPYLGLSTNQPHREWIYRQSYAVGRHVIGYELQKVFAAIDWFASKDKNKRSEVPVGVAGYGEGGLLALYAAALDIRIKSTLVSGYFDGRKQLWKEPIYRNIFGLLKTFGDAELAAMTWPRTLVIEQSHGPEIIHKNEGATPAIITSPLPAGAQSEFRRAEGLLPARSNQLHFIYDASARKTKPFSQNALRTFARGLNTELPTGASVMKTIVKANLWVDTKKRQERMVREMSSHVQHVLSVCERTRNSGFWAKIEKDTSDQKSFKEDQRQKFWNVLGRLPTPSIPFNAKARLLKQTDTWTSYEVTLDVFSPDVYAWGILVVPKGIKEGEKRPAVVCQHGLEGLPGDLVTLDSLAENYHYYKGLGIRLAERGYITFSPHNPYRGGDKFRVIQRQANPLGLTLFSVIISQHERIVEWLQQLSFVNPSRIGFYGLSYGGKTAMRVPAVVQGYALSICSADFNEWVRKVSTTEYAFGYVYTNEYDMPEWDLGHTFNYAEMAALIAPRPFMVERGHFDGVGTDEWVNYEFGKVRRHYDLLGLNEHARIEHFVGPHAINGKGTFEFLDVHLMHR